MLLLIFQWWRDVSREGSLLGAHSQIVETGLRGGIILFIVSEVFFFLSFFWRYFHSSLRPSVELGRHWVPMGIQTFNAFGVPLLNRIILLTSGASVTWCHHSFSVGQHSRSLLRLFFTIVLGVYFTFLQTYEYFEASFTISDGVFGSTFFVATGFHGLHVIIGTVFLLVSWFRIYLGIISNSHHFGLEAAAWYWHFVDVVWLFLYISIYCWRN